MNLLAIDTALEACSVGVVANGNEPVLRTEILGRGHSERLFAMAGSAMAEAGLAYPELDRIAVTVGPGSFTGLRVGIAAARGLALVVGCAVAGIGTLAVIAERAREIAGAVPVLAVIDARRGEVYAQLFDETGNALSPPRADRPERFATLIGTDTMLAGSGAAAVAGEAALARIVTAESAPDIAALVRLGLVAPPSAAAPRPLYLRSPDAKPQNSAVSRR